jgi:hypothetical protein
MKMSVLPPVLVSGCGPPKLATPWKFPTTMPLPAAIHRDGVALITGRAADGFGPTEVALGGACADNCDQRSVGAGRTPGYR